MVDTSNQPLHARITAVLTQALEKVSDTIRNDFTAKRLSSTEEVSLSSSGNSRDSRKTQMPESKVRLGSSDGELIVLAKKYLEIVGLVFFVWLFGYFQFSVSWILLAVFIYLFRQRQRSQFKLRHRMLMEINKNEEQFIKARLDELPSWVFFPDVEKAEWVNRIVKQAWPYANKYLDKEIFRGVLVPLVRGTATALGDFSFEKLDLGEMPPRIGGIKVYTDNVRDQIMMDVEVFYAGDAHIKAKVKGLVVGIRDIQFVGEMRIILSPLINTIPIFGAVTYFFLKKPSIDFKLTDAGTLVDIPGLNDLMLGQIDDIVASMMVLPNRQVFRLVDGIQLGPLRYSNPQGVVRVFILRARNLVKADITLLGKGKSDPFVRVKAQGVVEYKTKTINNTTDPEWNEVHEFVVEQYESDSVEFEVYDEDPGKDDFIGRAQFPINSLVDKEAVDTWLTLKDVKKGSLNVSLQYFALTKQKSALELMTRINSPLIRPEKLSKSLLVCFIEQCTNLPRSRKHRREPNPFCRIQVEGSERRTPAFESQTNPKFEHVSQLFSSNPLQEKLHIEVCDAKNNNETIAFFELPIRYVYEADAMTVESQSFPLKSTSEPLENATIVLHLSLFTFSPGRASESRLNASPSSPVNETKGFWNNSTGDEQRETLAWPLTENENKLPSSPTQLQPPSPHNIGSMVNNRLTPDRKSMVVSQDPDLRYTKYGKIKLGIRYAATRRALSVTVYSCKDLINVHQQNLPDPYVRLHLLPDFKKDKKKTKSIHDTLNPEFDDYFEWSGALADIRRQRLHLSLKNNSPLFAQEQTYMGDLQVDLANLDPERTSVSWYALQEPNTSGGGIMKIKYDTIEPVEHQTDAQK